MKNGVTIQELATEVQRQLNAKQDYTGPTGMMTMTADHEEGNVLFDLKDVGTFSILDHAHRQIGTHAGIPARYYDRMRAEAPGLLTHNVNHWFQAQSDNRLVRTLDGGVRAFLSDRYRPMDHAELIGAVLPVLDASGATIHSAQITETKLYIKAVMERNTVVIPRPSPAGDRSLGRGYQHDVEIQPGIVISNSEVGAGAVSIQPAYHELACLNMAVWAERALRKAHLGRRLVGDNDRIDQYLSDRTVQLADQALWSQVKDVTEAALSGTMFDAIVEQLRLAREQVFTGEQATAVIEKISTSRGLNESEQNAMLAHLIDRGELSQYGVQAAITRASQDLPDYDRASELEQMGGEIVSLTPRDWNSLIAAR